MDAKKSEKGLTSTIFDRIRKKNLFDLQGLRIEKLDIYSWNLHFYFHSQGIAVARRGTKNERTNSQTH